MNKLSTPWVIWLILCPLLSVDASPQFSTTLVSKLWEFLPIDKHPTVVNCMSETSAKLVTWQNKDFPKSESLPGICTLTLNPAEGTCAYRLNFDNMDLKSSFDFSSLFTGLLACSLDKPFIKVSTVNYTAPARCQDLTGYEGIVQLPEGSKEPVIILLQTDPNSNFSFRVNISSVACTDVNTFKSSHVCGIKNQLLDGSAVTRNSLRSDAPLAEPLQLEKEPAQLEKEPKNQIKDYKTVGLKEENPGDTTLEKPASPVEIAETVEKARKRRQINDQHSAELHTSNSDSVDGSSANQHITNPDSTNPDFRRLPTVEVKNKNRQKTKQENKQKKQEKVQNMSKSDDTVALSEDAKEFVEKLQKAGNIISYGIGAGIKNGEFEYVPQVPSRIKGQPTNPNEWPWMVLIEFLVELDLSILFPTPNPIPSIKATCNGALVDESHVITAASCLPGYSLLKGSSDSVRVILGDHDVLDPDDTKIINTTVSKITFPWSYSHFELMDNIAVLTLSEPVTFNDTIRPVCFPVSHNRFTDDSGVLAGWENSVSISSTTPVPNPFFESKLNALDMKVLNETTCNETISSLVGELQLSGFEPSIDADDFICAVEKNTELATCAVGPGSPLFRADITTAHYLYGVSNPSNSFCGSSVPNVFTAIKPDDMFLNLALD